MTGPVDQRSFELQFAVLAEVSLGGRTYAAIAADLGTTKSAVCGIVMRAGLAKPNLKARKQSPDLDDLYLRNIREGLSRRPSLYFSADEA